MEQKWSKKPWKSAILLPNHKWDEYQCLSLIIKFEIYS
jgi:hypothetical protein